MSGGATLVTHLTDQYTSFREDAPRPPVPGEEGQTPCQLTSQRSKSLSLPSNTRRNEDGLGEPEGSASPDSPLVRWTKSLHSLLGDQDGAHLFRTFLEREKCVDTLDFWFACNGFRQMDLRETKTLRVAKVIHKRYIESPNVVAKQLKLSTKTFIRDCIKRQQIGSTMFDHAQAEIQGLMEDNAYQMFLTSDIYLEYIRTGEENAAYFHTTGPGSLKLVTSYLPTLDEEEELNCVDLKGSPTVVELSTRSQKATASSGAKDAIDICYRSYQGNYAISPYHVSSGLVLAPASSANESEVSSDAMTDDAMSMTDSSVDGAPLYHSSDKKQLQRDMNRSVKVNGQVALPHFPRIRRLPREMTPVEPEAFAAELIARLQRVKQEQETMQALEERPQQVTEEEREECATPICFQTPCEPLTSNHQRMTLASCDYDDPQAILDDHLSRVLKTPGCQSPPGLGRSRSPEHSRVQPTVPRVQSVSSPLLSRNFVTKQTTKHVHHHYIHHHRTAPRSTEEVEAEAARRVLCLCSGPADYCCYLRTRTRCRGVDNAGSRSGTLSRRKVMSEHPGNGGVEPPTGLYQLPVDQFLPTAWQRMAACENKRPSKHRSRSAQNIRSNVTCETTRASSAERPARSQKWSALTRSQQLPHPPVLNTTLLSIGTLAQLEEACRRLAEVSKPKPRGPSSHQRSYSMPCSTTGAITQQKEPKILPSAPCPQSSELTVTYFFCGEEIPYRRMLRAHSLTLGHFKDQLSKKGNYRYYFKKASQEFDCGAVFEEICDDAAFLPLYEGRVLGKVELIN
ncbi:axin-2 [Dendrobates tinctorius]|uniref:axin-2 n=1 Tax=Dendrobates tinctorius TaxID=92724 RepID=UPI003CC9466B